MIKEVFPKLLNSFDVYKDVISTIDFSTIDSVHIEKIIDDVLIKHPNKVSEYKNGKTNLINMLFGEVMKMAGGKINTHETKEMLENKLK